MSEQYPDGKISEDDRGQIDMIVRVWRGRVRLDFSASLGWIGLLPSDARELAAKLIQVADVCDAMSEHTGTPKNVS